ncbi:hypothetical protein HOA92_03895 [archaeon]|jgi:hypothetical protein|nr:hypothetical protein [archaeon]MBT6762155.1 hypothetical protein [archaeon]
MTDANLFGKSTVKDSSLKEWALPVLGALAVHTGALLAADYDWRNVESSKQMTEKEAFDELLEEIVCTDNPSFNMVSPEKAAFVDSLAVDLSDGQLDSMTFTEFVVRQEVFDFNQEELCIENTIDPLEELVWFDRYLSTAASLIVGESSFERLESAFNILHHGLPIDMDAPENQEWIAGNSDLIITPLKKYSKPFGRVIKTRRNNGVYNCDSGTRTISMLAEYDSKIPELEVEVFDDHVRTVLDGRYVENTLAYFDPNFEAPIKGVIRPLEHFVVAYIDENNGDISKLHPDLQKWVLEQKFAKGIKNVKGDGVSALGVGARTQTIEQELEYISFALEASEGGNYAVSNFGSDYDLVVAAVKLDEMISERSEEMTLSDLYSLATKRKLIGVMRVQELALQKSTGVSDVVFSEELIDLTIKSEREKVKLARQIRAESLEDMLSTIIDEHDDINEVWLLTYDYTWAIPSVLVDRIIDGEDPNDLYVIPPEKLELLLNNPEENSRIQRVKLDFVQNFVLGNSAAFSREKDKSSLRYIFDRGMKIITPLYEDTSVSGLPVDMSLSHDMASNVKIGVMLEDVDAIKFAYKGLTKEAIYEINVRAFEESDTYKLVAEMKDPRKAREMRDFFVASFLNHELSYFVDERGDYLGKMDASVYQFWSPLHEAQRENKDVYDETIAAIEQEAIDAERMYPAQVIQRSDLEETYEVRQVPIDELINLNQ